ncbi:MAG: putative lipase [Candidatus Dojkabacteria bacterium]|nr:putative lipase [Candidatus Dojkabacteria bacterium]
MKNILYIHGAWASKNSFNYIVEKIKNTNNFFFEYELNKRVQSIAEDALSFAKENIKGKYSIIGHSLGGIIGHKIAELDENCEELLTLASPYGGTFVGSIAHTMKNMEEYIQNMNFLNFTEVLKNSIIFSDIFPNSEFLNSLKELKNTFHASVICTGGKIPLFNEKHDNVVTVSSQEKSPTNIKVYFDSTHNEILLREETIRVIEKWFFDY